MPTGLADGRGLRDVPLLQTELGIDRPRCVLSDEDKPLNLVPPLQFP